MNSYFSSTWGIEEEEEQAFYFVLYFSGKFKGKTKKRRARRADPGPAGIGDSSMSIERVNLCVCVIYYRRAPANKKKVFSFSLTERRTRLTIEIVNFIF